MENKASPFFTGFLGKKSQCAIFGGSYLEIKPLEYKLEVLQISIHNSDKIETSTYPN
jgi:hypothetical protein